MKEVLDYNRTQNFGCESSGQDHRMFLVSRFGSTDPHEIRHQLLQAWEHSFRLDDKIALLINRFICVR